MVKKYSRIVPALSGTFRYSPADIACTNPTGACKSVPTFWFSEYESHVCVGPNALSSTGCLNIRQPILSVLQTY